MSELIATHTGVALEAAGRDLERLGPVALGDLLLGAMITRKVAAVSLEPGRDRHVVRADVGGGVEVLGSIPAALGDAVCARLALVASIELGGAGLRLGRVRTRDGDASAELLIAVRSGPSGLAVAIQRIVTPDAEPDAVSNADSASFRYKLLDEIGRGGMGVVYRAKHVVLDKPVAIKVLRSGLTADPVLAAQFVLEARAACRARHPGIVDVTDFGLFDDGRAFLAMELIEAPTLEQVLAEGALSPERAIAIARRVAEALGAAADAGVVHRDLKPSNVFVLEGDQVKIGDFGVACILGAGVGSLSSIVGTAEYMAPEQATGEPVDARADLYALGCVLYEMLTGRRPFEAESMPGYLELHAQAPVPPIDSPHGPLPVEVVRVVHRAMAKRASERYQSAAELVADLAVAARALAPLGWRRWQS